MKNYLFFVITLFFLSCKTEVQKEQSETIQSDTLKVTEIEPKIDTLFEYRENSLKIIIQKGDIVLNQRTYLLSEENKYDSLGNKKEVNKYDSPGSYGMKWVTYYEDESLKEKGQIIGVSGGFLEGGEHLRYTKDGELEKRLTYSYDTNYESYHQIIIRAKLIEYYAGEKIKSERYFKGAYDFSVNLSDNQEEDKDKYYKDHAIGTWKFYNEKGKIIKTEKY